MTERLYYSDCYLREFRARVLETADSGKILYLDRTAFYPSSGGQPFDLGTLNGVDVLEVSGEEDRVAHLLAAPLAAQEVEGRIDWARRFDHMQQHTGQHLLSAVLEELYRIPTLSFHMGAEASTIEVDAPALDPAQIERAEGRCAEIAMEARPVAIAFEDAASVTGLRKESQRGGTLRIVSIEGLDRSACGGTHVRSTAEIGMVQIRGIEKVRGHARLEFVCGFRALRRARADYRMLASLAQTLSAPLDRAPKLAAGLAGQVKALEKLCRTQSLDLASREGRELYTAAPADSNGIRRLSRSGPIDEAMRARAQAFVAAGQAVFLAVCENPPSLLLAASADAGVHAGDRVKTTAAARGGRGGGNPALAQASLPSLEALAGAIEDLGFGRNQPER